MTNIFKYIIPLFIAMILFACSNGNNRELSSTASGNYQSYAQITLGGNKSQDPVLVKTLQDYTESFVCDGISINRLALDTFSLNNSGGDKYHTGRTLCNANKNYINNESNLFGGVDLSSFIESNPLGIKSVNMYQITYNTPGQAFYYGGNGLTNETVSGLVIIPNGISQENIKGVVLFYHPTAFAKTDVPSMQNRDTQIMLASLYAAQGYIVVAPDYVGQGIDNHVMHPYVLYAQNNALAGINMLSATRQFLATESVFNNGSQNTTIPLTVKKNLYITSYSEGGAYALWTSRLLQGENASALLRSNLTLKLTVGIEGAYDLSNAMIPYAYANAINSEDPKINIFNISPGMLKSDQFYLAGGTYLGNFTIESGIQQSVENLYMGVSKSSLASYAFTSFINYNYGSTAYPLFFPNSKFFNNQTCLNAESYLASLMESGGPAVVPQACPIQDSLPNLFTNTSYTNSVNIASSIALSAMWNTNYLTNGESATAVVNNIYNGKSSYNTVSAFANPVLNNPELMRIIGSADTWSYKTNSPTSIVSMNYDSTVTPLNAINACSKDGVKGLSPSGMVTCITVDNTKFYTAVPLPPKKSLPFLFQLPLMMEHGNAMYILHMIALNQIKQHP